MPNATKSTNFCNKKSTSLFSNSTSQQAQVIKKRPTQLALIPSPVKAEVLEKQALRNSLLVAKPVPQELAVGEDRYYLRFCYTIPAQFTRDEVRQALEASDGWAFPSTDTLRQLVNLLEEICWGGAA